MARKQHTSAHTNTSNNSDHLPTARRALYLVPSFAHDDAPHTRCILQSDLLLAALDWTEERGWQISYFTDDLPADVRGETWRSHYFDNAKPIATSQASAHPSLRLLRAGDQLAVWRIARTVLHQLETAMMRQIEADARRTA